MLLLSSPALEPLLKFLGDGASGGAQSPEFLSWPPLGGLPAGPEGPPVAEHAMGEALSVRPQKGSRAE